MKLIFMQIYILLVIIRGLNAQEVSVKNGILWRDTNGNRIQAHSLCIIQHDGIYYMIGKDHSDGNAFKGINMYSSADLVNWKFLNTIIDKNTNSDLNSGTRFCERPNIIYNASTNKFIVWTKYQNPGYTANEVAIFYSNTIDGKYTFHKAYQPLGYDTNDCSFFKDEDGSAYFISRNKEYKSLNLYKLTNDYLDVVNCTVLFAGSSREAPVLFKKDDIYFILSSGLSGWDPNQAKYATSKSLTSGWSSLKNFGDKFTYDTQPCTYIIIPGISDTTYLYVGDRWKDPDIRESKNIFFPLTINGTSLSMKYIKEFKVNITEGTWEKYDGNTYVPQEDWKLVSANSLLLSTPATNAFDNNDLSIWHTHTTTHPHEIVIDLGADYAVSGFEYVPRQDNNANGIVKDFQLFFSLDGNNWGAPVAAGSISYWNEIYFPQAITRFMKFVSRTEFNNQDFSSAAELKLIVNSDYKHENLIPYYKVDNGGWMNNTNINIKEGSTLYFGPQPGYYGSYSYYGPSNFYSNTRATTIEDITTAQAGEYTCYYLDDRFNCHKKILKVNVISTSDVNSISDEHDNNYINFNPLDDIVSIGNTNENQNYSVYDLVGNKVLYGYGKSINVSNLVAGCYIVIIKDSRFKFIKD